MAKPPLSPARSGGDFIFTSGQLARDGNRYILHIASYDASTGRTLRMSEIVNTDPLALAGAAATQIIEASVGRP